MPPNVRVGKIVKAQIYPGKKVRIPVAAEMLEDGWLRFSVSLPDSTANTNASPAAAPMQVSARSRTDLTPAFPLPCLKVWGDAAGNLHVGAQTRHVRQDAEDTQESIADDELLVLLSGNETGSPLSPSCS